MFESVGTAEFKVPLFRRGSIVSKQGFELLFEGRERLRYREHGLDLVIAIDTGGGCVTVFHHRLTDQTGSAHEIASAKDDRRIFDNIARALEWRGFIVELAT